MNSPVRLGVSPAPSTSTGFYQQRFWGFTSPCWNPGLHCLSPSPVVPPSLSTCKCGTTWSTSHPLTHPGPLAARLATLSLHPVCLSLPLLPVWMNVSSLTPWLLDFHTVWFSGSSGCLLFLNFLLSFFWLCEEAKCIYLCLHLGQKSSFSLFSYLPYNSFSKLLAKIKP